MRPKLIDFIFLLIGLFNALGMLWLLFIFGSMLFLAGLFILAFPLSLVRIFLFMAVLMTVIFGIVLLLYLALRLVGKRGAIFAEPESKSVIAASLIVGMLAVLVAALEFRADGLVDWLAIVVALVLIPYSLKAIMARQELALAYNIGSKQPPTRSAPLFNGMATPRTRWLAFALGIFFIGADILFWAFGGVLDFFLITVALALLLYAAGDTKWLSRLQRNRVQGRNNL